MTPLLPNDPTSASNTRGPLGTFHCCTGSRMLLSTEDRFPAAAGPRGWLEHRKEPAPTIKLWRKIAGGSSVDCICFPGGEPLIGHTCSRSWGAREGLSGGLDSRGRGKPGVKCTL